VAFFGAGVEGFQGGDDLLQVRLDPAQVGGVPGLAAGLSTGDQLQVGGGLAAVDVEELWRGLEIWAGQAGVGVRAVLLRRPPAVAVGQAVLDSGQVVLDPFGRGGGRIRVVADDLPGDVDPLPLVAVEFLADGGVVDNGTVGYWNPLNGPPGERSPAAESLFPSSMRF
jgi:hypothetical protein